MSQFIITKKAKSLTGDIKIEYYFCPDEVKSNKIFKNWFLINEKLIEFDNKIVVGIYILKKKHILVNIEYSLNKPLLDNFLMYNAKGNLLWKIEPPRSSNNIPLFRGYCFHTTMKEFQISKNGHLITYVPSVINFDGNLGTRMETWRNAIHYEIDLKTGKIVTIHEGVLPGELV